MKASENKDTFCYCLKRYIASKDCILCEGQGVNTANQPNSIPAGTILNEQYYIGRVIEADQFSIKYIAWDYKKECIVLIEEYFPSDYAARDYQHGIKIREGYQYLYQYGLERFEKETNLLAHSTAGINHIFPVIHHFASMQTFYRVSTFINGYSLEQKLNQKRGYKYAFEEALNILLPIIEALQVIHLQNIYHYDINPTNIWITEQGIYLINFSKAKFELANFADKVNIYAKSGYAPPEIYQNVHNIDASSDIYSLGACFYRLITGIRPPQKNFKAVDNKVLHLFETEVDIAKNHKTALMRALATYKQDRYNSTEAFRTAITAEPELPPATQFDFQKVINKALDFATPKILITGALIIAIIVFIAIMLPLITYNKEKNVAYYHESSSQLNEPAEITPNKITPSERLYTLFQKANQAIIDNALIEPPENSAYDYAKRALSLAPGDPRALSLLQDITDELLAQALLAIQNKNPEKANTLYMAAEEIIDAHLLKREQLTNTHQQIQANIFKTKLDEKMDQAYLMLYSMQFKLEEKENLLAYINEINQLDPSYHHSKILLNQLINKYLSHINVLIENQEYTQAELIYHQLYSLSFQYPLDTNTLKQIKTHIKDFIEIHPEITLYKRSQSALEKEINGLSIQIQNILSNIQISKREEINILNALDKIHSISPYHPEIYQLMGSMIDKHIQSAEQALTIQEAKLAQEEYNHAKQLDIYHTRIKALLELKTKLHP